MDTETPILIKPRPYDEYSLTEKAEAHIQDARHFHAQAQGILKPTLGAIDVGQIAAATMFAQLSTAQALMALAFATLARNSQVGEFLNEDS